MKSTLSEIFVSLSLSGIFIFATKTPRHKGSPSTAAKTH